MHLYLTEFPFEKDNVEFAQFIDSNIINKNDARNLSGIIMLTEDDIMNYKNLLSFDWAQYDKQESTIQPQLF